MKKKLHTAKTRLFDFVIESKREEFEQALEHYDACVFDNNQDSILKAMKKMLDNHEDCIDKILYHYGPEVQKNASDVTVKYLNERIEIMGEAMENRICNQMKEMDKRLEKRFGILSENVEDILKTELSINQWVTVQDMERVCRMIAFENDRMRSEVKRLEFELLQHRRIARALVNCVDDFHKKTNV